jgi:hypothetical protein
MCFLCSCELNFCIKRTGISPSRALNFWIASCSLRWVGNDVLHMIASVSICCDSAEIFSATNSTRALMRFKSWLGAAVGVGSYGRDNGERAWDRHFVTSPINPTTAANPALLSGVTSLNYGRSCYSFSSLDIIFSSLSINACWWSSR